MITTELERLSIAEEVVPVHVSLLKVLTRN
jgi:hypothetical protein